MQKISKGMCYLILFSMLMAVYCIPVYAAGPNPENLILESPGNPYTGEGEILRDKTTNCTWEVESSSAFGRDDPAGMSKGASEGGSMESNVERTSGEIQVSTVSGSTPTSYTVTREKVGDTQTITRTDGTAGTRDTYEIGGNTTQIVNTYEDGSEITTSFNSDGTTITTTNGQSWRDWYNTGGSSSDESSSGADGSSSKTPGTKGTEPSGGTTPTGPSDDHNEPIPGGREPDPSSNTNLYEFKHDNVTDGLEAKGTAKDKSGRELQITIIIPPVNPVPNPQSQENPSNQGQDGKNGKNGNSSQSDGTNGDGATVTVDGKTYPVNKDGTVTTSSGTPGSSGQDVYRNLQEFTEKISKVTGGQTITNEKPGELKITQELSDGTKKTWTVKAGDSIDFEDKLTKDDTTDSNEKVKIRFEHDIEYRPTFVGYDWTVENLTDQYSPFYMSPTSFTTPGMTERQYEGGPIDSGGLLPVGEGYIKEDCHGHWSAAEDYWFVNYGDHTATVTPWWNIDVWEHWYEWVTISGNDDDDDDEELVEFEEYLYSYKESRPPRIFKFNIGLVCKDCPTPAQGYRVCLGDNCDCDGTGNELMTVCDENHTGELDIENRVELEQ